MFKKSKIALLSLFFQLSFSSVFADTYFSDECLKNLKKTYVNSSSVFEKDCKQVRNKNQLKCHQALQSVNALNIETSYACIYKLDGDGQIYDNMANSVSIIYNKDSVRHLKKFSGFRGGYRLNLAMKMTSDELVQCVHGLFDIGQASDEFLLYCINTYSPYDNYNPSDYGLYTGF